jgi:hypothetical protein
MSSCSFVSALPIDAPNHPALEMRGKQKKIREIKFGPHCLLAQDASLRQYIGAADFFNSLWRRTIRLILRIRQDIAY